MPLGTLQNRAELWARNATIDLRPRLPGVSYAHLEEISAALVSAFLAGLGVACEPQLAREMVELLRPRR